MRAHTAFVAFVAAVAAYAVTVVVVAGLLPERVPLHFDASGQADRWASREVAVATMALVGAGLALLLAWSARVVRRLSLRWVNVPHRDWWTAAPDRVARLRLRLTADLHTLGTATMVLLTAVALLTLRAARADVARLDGWAWVTLGAYLLFVVAWTVWTLFVRYRPIP